MEVRSGSLPNNARSDGIRRVEMGKNHGIFGRVEGDCGGSLTDGMRTDFHSQIEVGHPPNANVCFVPSRYAKHAAEADLIRREEASE